MKWNPTLLSGRWSRWIGYGLLLPSCIPLVIAAVNNANPMNGFDLTDPLVPVEEIQHGGPPRDGIPALSNPDFVAATEADWLFPDDRVIGIEIQGERRAYPIRILNYHEIVNDRIGDTAFAITYCPLCGTGVAFDARVDGEEREFGVSGLLYNSDVLLYDRESESLWSQIMATAVSGPLKGTKLQPIPIQHTTWYSWLAGGESEVMSLDTGHNRDYSNTPYGSYDGDRELYFPVNATSTRYHPKERVLGIEINGVFKAYPFAELALVQSPVVDTIAGQELVLAFDAVNRSGEIRTLDGELLPAINGFWFAWYAFHPDTEIFRPYR